MNDTERLKALLQQHFGIKYHMEGNEELGIEEGDHYFENDDIDQAVAELQALLNEARLAELTPILEEATYASERAARKDLHSNVDGVLEMVGARIATLTPRKEQ